MSYTDEIYTVQNGPATWRDRLSATIRLTSPDGTGFEAKWRGDPRSGEKRLGIFSGPHWSGNVVQDLGVEADRYTFTIYFEGVDHDIFAGYFHEACKQRGTWTIVHPVHGTVELNLVRWTCNDDPTESGNVTQIDTEWVEPLNPQTLKTARQMAGIVDSLLVDYYVASTMWYEETVYDDTFGEQQACGQTADRLATAAESDLGDLARGNSDVRSAYNASVDGLADAVSSDTFSAASIASNLRGIIQAPALGSTDIEESLAAYSAYIDAVIETLPSGLPSNRAANKLATCESALDSALGAVCRVVTTGKLTTRAQAIAAAQSIAEMLSRVTSALDDAAELFNGRRIDRQYFSQAATYQAAVSAISKAVEYLLTAAFDLAVEKRFTLDRPKAPIGIVIEQYGDESRLDEFIATNSLRGIEILVLPAGREVVVYV